MEHNFFEEVEVKKPKTNAKKLIIILVLVAAFAYLLGFAGYNFYQRIQINQEIENLRAQVAIYAPQAALFSAAQLELMEHLTQFTLLAMGDIIASDEAVVTAELIENIRYTTPDNTRVRAFQISGREMRASGITENLEVLALFGHRFRNNDAFDTAIVRRALFYELDDDNLPDFIEGPYLFNAELDIATDFHVFIDLILRLYFLENAFETSGIANVFWESESFVGEMFQDEEELIDIISEAFNFVHIYEMIREGVNEQEEADEQGEADEQV